jgi:hypothetical protein
MITATALALIIGLLADTSLLKGHKSMNAPILDKVNPV